MRIVVIVVVVVLVRVIMLLVLVVLVIDLHRQVQWRGIKHLRESLEL